jgi:hypothetical protein
LNGDLSERSSARRDRDREAERHPTLAELRSAGHERESFGKQSFYREARLRERLGHELASGPAGPPVAVGPDDPDRDERAVDVLVLNVADDARAHHATPRPRALIAP